jgi:hypothetical protein
MSQTSNFVVISRGLNCDLAMDQYFGHVRKRSRSAKAAGSWFFGSLDAEPVLPADVPESPEIHASDTEDSDDDVNEPVDIVPVEVPAEELIGEALDQSIWVVLWPDFTCTLETLKFISRTKNRSTTLLISR